jgi:aminoglycoside phosphotransferase (APT) family kinase protein
VHGGFKPAQLVYIDTGRVAVTDFDGVRLADPALDVGYFLAYLRPASLWRGRPASRAWFTAAAAEFTAAYARSMVARGARAADVDGILRRASLHEAAALLKIAGRRPHRCNAPRPGELAAMLEEIEGCLGLQPAFSADPGSSALPSPFPQGPAPSWSPSPTPQRAARAG